MNNNSSYSVADVATNCELEINRLTSQVELFWDQELNFYKRQGLGNGTKILEVGSGPGCLSNKLLETFDNIELVSMEIDPILTDYAKMNQIDHNGDHTIVIGDIENSDLGDNQFDFVIMRLVLEHFNDPTKSLNEINRVLKPGGKVILIDNDFGIHLQSYPNVSDLNILYRAYCNARIDQGGKPMIGRELPTWLLKCGFKVDSFESICAHSVVIGEDIFTQSEGMGITTKLMEDGYLSIQDLSKILREWKKMKESPDRGILRQLFVATGVKL